MKKHIHFTGIWLWVALMALMVACDPKEKVVEPMEKPLPELATIDSLMWRQPDSAFAVLRQFAASPQADSLDVFNGHYCQLLISELLYKKDYEQSNREALLEAVVYFDSLILSTHGIPQQERNVFLNARVHYINGVGYYEQEDIVQACAEYLKALEVMEGNFKDNELIGKKAIFMTYTYNRLTELFSEQFMMEPAIACGEKALMFCRIEPTSSEAVSNNLYYLGKQYDKMNDVDRAKWYYGQALEELTNTDNLVYRNVISSKALCDYQSGHGIESSLYALKQALVSASNEEERLTRFLTIGVVFTEGNLYDSALFYLGPVFNNEKDVASQIQAAECLRIIYDSLGDVEKSNTCVRFLADQKKSEGENKALTSKLEAMFKTYMDQKQEKQAIEEREKAILKTINIIIPITIIIALIIFIVVKLRSKKLLKKQQEDADRILGKTEQQHKEELKRQQAEAEKTLEERDKRHAEVLEAEWQIHRMEQAAMSGRLKRSNQEVRELKDQIKQKDDLVTKTEIAISFNEEPICRLIMERVHDGQFKSKIDCELYKSYALDKQQLLDLRMAADRHYSHFTLRLRKAYPKLTNIDIDYCCLYLLNLTYADVSALMQRAYNTVVERDGKIQKIIGSEKPLPITLMDIAQNTSSM